MQRVGRIKKASENTDSFGIPIFEDMASYDSRDTGLPMNIIILAKSGERHGPRIKVQQDYGKRLNKDNVSSVTISDEPSVARGHKWLLTQKDFTLVKAFILKNKKALTKYWNNELLTRDFESMLKRV